MELSNLNSVRLRLAASAAPLRGNHYSCWDTQLSGSRPLQQHLCMGGSLDAGEKVWKPQNASQNVLEKHLCATVFVTWVHCQCNDASS